MFSKATAPVAEPAREVSEISDTPIPPSHLGLDLPEPPIGWTAYLSNIGVEILQDGIGRSAVSSADARMLISEHRANGARKAEVRAESERRAIEADQRFRASLGVGVPADLIPAGSTEATCCPSEVRYVEAALAAELDNVAAGYRPGRRSLVEDALDNSGITFHSVQSAPEDAS